MPIANELMTKVLILGLDDWVHLAEVAGIVRNYSSVNDTLQLRRETIELINSLLSNNYVRVGDLVGSGAKIQFRAWEMDTQATTKEIESRWVNFGGPLSPESGNDVCWLINTQEGDLLAETKKQSDNR